VRKRLIPQLYQFGNVLSLWDFLTQELALPVSWLDYRN